MSNQKFFIDYVNKNRQCGDCLETKPFSDFSLHSVKLGRPKSYCKKCLSIRNNRRNYEKLLERYPKSFFECDNCDRVMSIRSKQKHIFSCKENLYPYSAF